MVMENNTQLQVVGKILGYVPYDKMENINRTGAG
jgi:hypothetical protein